MLGFLQYNQVLTFLPPNADSGADIKRTSELMIGISGTVPTQIKIRTANHAMGKNSPRPVPMEQDTDLFKQKIRLLNESAKRARTESIRIIQASLNVSTVCWTKPTPSSSRTRTWILSMSTRVFDEESSTESKSNLAMKEISVVVAIFDRFGPATNAFLDSPAANGIAGFMFSEMHVKEQGLVKLRSKFALQGFHSSVSAASQSELSQVGSCGGTATLFRSYLAISHPFGSIQPGAAGFDWSSITLLLKGTPVMFVSVYLTCNTGITGANLQKLSEIGAHVKDAGIPFVIAGDWNVPPSELLESSWPARIKGEVLPPFDLEISCISGRLIDFAVCHRSIVNIASLRSFVECPWKTHQALLLTLPRSPRSFFTRSLVASPTKFPRLDRNAGSVPWSDFIHQSKSLHFQPPCVSLPSHLDPDPRLSQKLALRYKRWSSASE